MTQVKDLCKASGGRIILVFGNFDIPGDYACDGLCTPLFDSTSTEKEMFWQIQLIGYMCKFGSIVNQK